MAKDMTKGSIARTLISFSLPLIFSGLMQQLYSWADAFIVGNVSGEGALAAIGASSVISGLMSAVITGFTAGVSILSAQRFGCGEKDVQKKMDLNKMKNAIPFYNLFDLGGVSFSVLLFCLDFLYTFLLCL